MTLPDGPIRLLLLHGSRLNAAAWGPLEDELLGTIVCTHIDLPGHGERVHERFTLERALEVVSEAVAEIDPHAHRVVLAGHSLGGYVALEWASRTHGSLAGLVLMGATAQPASRVAGVYKAVGGALRAGLEDERRAESIRGSEAAQLRRIIGARTAEAIHARGSGLEAIPDAWDAVIEQVDLTSLADVDVPVLAINGEYDQFRIGMGLARRVRPDLESVLVAGATHFAPITHAAQVGAAISDFVRALP